MPRAWARRALSRYIVEPCARLLLALKLGPNAVTLLGLALAVVAGVLAARGSFPWAALVLLASGVFDLLDGAMARMAGRATPFGAVLDSLSDRLGEAALFLGLLLFYAWGRSTPGVVLAFLASVASYSVSYVRARSEGLGVGGGERGLLTRPERILVLAAGLVLNLVLWALAIILALSVVTVGQRLRHLWQETRTR